MLVLFSSFPCSSAHCRELTTAFPGSPHQSSSGWVQPMGGIGGRVGKMEKPVYLASTFCASVSISAVYILWLLLSIYFWLVLLCDPSSRLRSHHLLPLLLHFSPSPVLPYIARGLTPIRSVSQALVLVDFHFPLMRETLEAD